MGLFDCSIFYVDINFDIYNTMQRFCILLITYCYFVGMGSAIKEPLFKVLLRSLCVTLVTSDAESIVAENFLFLVILPGVQVTFFVAVDVLNCPLVQSMFFS